MLIHSAQQLAMVVANQRKKTKTSQKNAADLVGLKQQTISTFENKPGSTELDTLFRVLAAMNLDMYIVPKGTKIQKDSEYEGEW